MMWKGLKAKKMDDFIMEFLDWYSDFCSNIREAIWKAMKLIGAVVGLIILMPIWLVPFVFWLVFEKLKGGEDDG